MPFKKGKSGNESGRGKGNLSKTTKTARELFVGIMEGQVSHIEDSLEKVRRKNPEAYLNVLAKFYPYFIPKKVDVTTNDMPIPAPIIDLSGT